MAAVAGLAGFRGLEAQRTEARERSTQYAIAKPGGVAVF
jgi:hypothetical protein